MSWSGTYSHTVLLAIDRLGAALIFNQADITISSLCWVVLTAHEGFSPLDVRATPDSRVAYHALDQLKLSPWQYKALLGIGNVLERFWPGHCARARQGDLQTGERARQLLAG